MEVIDVARPKKVGMDYFPHDVNAANDPKVETLCTVHGAEGYAFYFIMLETIYRQAEAKLDISDDDVCAMLARKCYVTLDKWRAMLKTAIKLKLFSADMYEQESSLTSTGIQSRANVVAEERERKTSKSGKTTEKPQEIAGVEPELTEEQGNFQSYSGVIPDITTGITPEGQPKEKESKVNNIKPNNKNKKDTPQSPRGGKSVSDYTDVFDKFWSIYPRKIDKQTAFKAFKTLLKAKESADTILLCAKHYRDECVAQGTDQQFIKHAATFLREGRYKDYLTSRQQMIPEPPQQPPQEPEEETPEQQAEREEKLREIAETMKALEGGIRHVYG
jgi:uncharacterized protein YdaU (DUF1376 family)